MKREFDAVFVREIAKSMLLRYYALGHVLFVLVCFGVFQSVFLSQVFHSGVPYLIALFFGYRVAKWTLAVLFVGGDISLPWVFVRLILVCYSTFFFSSLVGSIMNFIFVGIVHGETFSTNNFYAYSIKPFLALNLYGQPFLMLVSLIFAAAVSLAVKRSERS